MKITLLLQGPRRATGLLALMGALSATACGVETIESLRRPTQAVPKTLAFSALGVTDHGVPAASKVDFGQSSPATTSDLTY